LGKRFAEHEIVELLLTLAATTFQIKGIDHLLVSADAAISFGEAGLL
jgi:DNA repair protein RadC